MTDGPDARLAAPLERLRALLGEVFAAPEALAGRVVAGRRAVLAAGGTYGTADLAGTKPLIIERLDALPEADGLGLLVAPGLLPDRERHIEWWQRGATGYVPLRLNLDPTSVDVYDYFAAEWYVAARDGGRRMVFGPYVDYSGADRYICTCTVPVYDGDRFLGVAGIDLRMDGLESRLLGALRGADRDAVLVGRERRVVAANCSRWLVGSRLPRAPRAGDGTFAAVGEVGMESEWTLALTAPREGLDE